MFELWLAHILVTSFLIHMCRSKYFRIVPCSLEHPVWRREYVACLAFVQIPIHCSYSDRSYVCTLLELPYQFSSVRINYCWTWTSTRKLSNCTVFHNKSRILFIHLLFYPQENGISTVGCRIPSRKRWIDYFSLEMSAELFNITTLMRLSNDFLLGFNSIKFLLNCDSVASDGRKRSHIRYG